VICDNALLSGFALGRQPVGRQIVLDVIRDFDLRRDDAVDRQIAEDADTADPASSAGSSDSIDEEASSGAPADPAGRPKRFAFFGARS